jgi:hypothetical protein
MDQTKKIKLDLAAAAEAEVAGALAVGRPRVFRKSDLAASVTALRSLLGVFKQAGIGPRPVRIGKLSLRLDTRGRRQMLVLQD